MKKTFLNLLLLTIFCASTAFLANGCGSSSNSGGPGGGTPTVNTFNQEVADAVVAALNTQVQTTISTQSANSLSSLSVLSKDLSVASIGEIIYSDGWWCQTVANEKLSASTFIIDQTACWQYQDKNGSAI